MTYALTVKDFENALWDLFSEALGGSLEIYFGRTNFIKPDGSFVTLRIAQMNPLESPGYSLGHGPTDPEKSYINYEVIVDIRTFRGSAIATASTLRHSLDMKELWLKHLNNNNIGYLRSSTISDVAIPLDGEIWEARAAFTSIFHIIVELDDIAGTDGAVETVTVTEGTIKPDGIKIVQTDVITLT